MGYLLSIVVPTKDRYPYLKHLIQLIKNFNSDGIELVVQDNTYDNTEILEYLSELDFPHLKYYYTKEQLSVSDNSTKGILNSTGEYVCFIGDDDGVTHYIVDAVTWMKSNGYNILKSAPAVLKWPSFHSPKHYDVSGTVQFNDFKFTYSEKNCKKSLETLLKTGIDTLGTMPKVYNGIVKRSTLDTIYNKCGTYFPGPSPDMANAVALAIVEDIFVYVDFPIIIGGHSGHLGGDAAKYKKGLGPLEDQPFISQEAKENWSPRIPKLWGAKTVWPESARTALLAFGQSRYADMIDYEVILRKFIVDHWEYARTAYTLSQHKLRLLFSCIYHILIKLVMLRVTYWQYKKHDIFWGLKIHRGLSNISEAENYLCKDIKEFCVKQAY